MVINSELEIKIKILLHNDLNTVKIKLRIGIANLQVCIISIFNQFYPIDNKERISL